MSQLARLSTLALGLSLASPALAQRAEPAPCRALPATVNLASYTYTSPLAIGNFEVTVSFPNLREALCTSTRISGTDFVHFQFEGATEQPRIQVRNAKGEILQDRTFTYVRMVLREQDAEGSLIKAHTGLSDLDILTVYPKLSVVRENMERGGSYPARAARVELR